MSAKKTAPKKTAPKKASGPEDQMLTCRFCGKKVDKGAPVGPEDAQFVCDDHADHATGATLQEVLTAAAASKDKEVSANAKRRLSELKQ